MTAPVALRKESVDRNNLIGGHSTSAVASLSARRAWIEIVSFRGHDFWTRSLSARRAWIEIGPLLCSICQTRVALRKESVDRNCDSDPVTDKAWASLSARRAWIEIGYF